MPGAQEETNFVSRNFHLMMLVGQSIGLTAATAVPSAAIKTGAFGYMIWYVILCAVMGTPLFYMELIIGQFTGLDAFEVWKVRPIFSHIGYILLAWQIVILLINHIVSTYAIHYMIVSFRIPQLYYTCGEWARSDCNIISWNFTINQDCISSGPKYEYCNELFLTDPEVQYYRALSDQGPQFTVDWEMCLPCGLACLFLYLSCFKGKYSMKWSLAFVTFYPSLGFVILFLGSLLQKGILKHFQEAINIDFHMTSSYSILDIARITTYTFTMGSGLVINAGANCPFRAPCYANSVLTITIHIVFHVLIVCTSALMVCPYSYAYGISTDRTINTTTSFLFERVPTMLRHYDVKTAWVILAFSSYACVVARTTVIVYYNLFEMFVKRFPKTGEYPGLVTFAASVILFVVTMPLLKWTLNDITSKAFRCSACLISIFIVMFECVVFILWYGLDRFCEDVHFMQGVRPGNFMKFAWTVLTVLLIYVIGDELYKTVVLGNNLERRIGVVGTWLVIFYTLGMAAVKVLWSAFKKDLGRLLRLSADWKPRNEVLQRSRAMFTAQAMTKEYLYRQYHLQAGILARQRRANCTRDNTHINI